MARCAAFDDTFTVTVTTFRIPTGSLPRCFPFYRYTFWFGLLRMPLGAALPSPYACPYHTTYTTLFIFTYTAHTYRTRLHHARVSHTLVPRLVPSPYNWDCADLYYRCTYVMYYTRAPSGHTAVHCPTPPTALRTLPSHLIVVLGSAPHLPITPHV